MLGCSIYLIVALAHDHSQWYEKLILIATITYFFLMNIKIIACALVIVLVPVAALGFLIYFCCCNNSNQKSITTP
jgi:hypothetical protein